MGVGGGAKEQVQLLLKQASLNLGRTRRCQTHTYTYTQTCELYAQIEGAALVPQTLRHFAKRGGWVGGFVCVCVNEARSAVA